MILTFVMTNHLERMTCRLICDPTKFLVMLHRKSRLL